MPAERAYVLYVAESSEGSAVVLHRASAPLALKAVGEVMAVETTDGELDDVDQSIARVVCEAFGYPEER